MDWIVDREINRKILVELLLRLGKFERRAGRGWLNPNWDIFFLFGLGKQKSLLSPSQISIQFLQMSLNLCWNKMAFNTPLIHKNIDFKPYGKFFMRLKQYCYIYFINVYSIIWFKPYREEDNGPCGRMLIVKSSYDIFVKLIWVKSILKS